MIYVYGDLNYKTGKFTMLTLKLIDYSALWKISELICNKITFDFVISTL